VHNFYLLSIELLPKMWQNTRIGIEAR